MMTRSSVLLALVNLLRILFIVPLLCTYNISIYIPLKHTLQLGEYGGRPSVLLQSDTQRYKAGEAVCISYGELSFQQKLLSFGWVDRSLDISTSFCITPLTLTTAAGERVEVEIKTRIVSYAGEDKLKAVRSVRFFTITYNSDHYKILKSEQRVE